MTAALMAATVGGVPSTVWAFVTGGEPLAAVRAAGTLLPARRKRGSIVGGIVVHLAVSSFWTALFALAARRWHLGIATGALAGLGIAGIDLGVIARRYPAVADLPKGAQVIDHLVFGAVLGGVLSGTKRAASATS